MKIKDMNPEIQKIIKTRRNALFTIALAIIALVGYFISKVKDHPKVEPIIVIEGYKIQENKVIIDDSTYILATPYNGDMNGGKKDIIYKLYVNDVHVDGAWMLHQSTSSLQKVVNYLASPENLRPEPFKW